MGNMLFYTAKNYFSFFFLIFVGCIKMSLFQAYSHPTGPNGSAANIQCQTPRDTSEGPCPCSYESELL